MGNALKLAFGSILTAAVLVGLLAWKPVREDDAKILVFYCAAGMRVPVEEAVKAYEQEYKISIRMQYGGSGTLLNSIQQARLGDLYLAADDSYFDLAREKGLLAEVLPLAKVRPVVAVAKGNPKHITSLADLWRADVKVALANPEGASIGKQSKAHLQSLGKWEDLRKAVESRGVFKPTVEDVANDVKLRAVDAAIVWDHTARKYPDDVESIVISELESIRATTGIGILTTSDHPTAALRFARYLAARDRGLKEFGRERGFEAVEGDVWAERPEVVLYSGAMLRPAIQKTVDEFKEREDCNVQVVYNGCGILVSQMKSGSPLPDAYFSCDASFMAQVQDFFDGREVISGNQVVILLPKGNPKGIRTVQDLARPGLKVGLAHAEKAALGKLTEALLKEAGVHEGVHRNAENTDSAASADFLVNQMRAGALDAALVYKSSANGPKEHLDVVMVEGPLAQAVQPLGIGKSSTHKYLMERLKQKILSPTSQERFLEAGFRWSGGAVKE